MKKGTTSTGFAFELDESRLDDMRIVDAIAVTMDETAGEFAQIAALSQLLTLIIGAEQKKALYEHIGASYEGRVPRLALQAALTEIMGSAGKDAEKN